VRRWIRAWLMEGWQGPVKEVRVEVPVIRQVKTPPYDWRDGPIRLTEEQFRALVAGLNRPDMEVAKLIRRADNIEMRITRLDESTSGVLLGIYQRDDEFRKKTEGRLAGLEGEMETLKRTAMLVSDLEPGAASGRGVMESNLDDTEEKH